jgi:MFS family permease
MNPHATARLRQVQLTALAATIGCVAALHLLRGDLPPLRHRLSEYANGPYGWLMTAAFTTLGVAMLALGGTLRRRHQQQRQQRPAAPARIPGTAGLACLAGIGALTSALFPTAGSALRELIHSAASTSAAVAIVALALLRSLPPMARSGHGSSWDATSRLLALAAPPLLVLSVVVHHTAWAGLGQRLLWVVLLASLLLPAAPLDPPRPERDVERTAPRQRSR